MKTKLTRFAVVAVLVLTLLFSAVSAVSSLEKQSDAQYTNPETSYQVLIIDELSLLTESEQAKLAEEMMPLTKYGHAIFWTTDEYAYDAIEQARLKRKELYVFDSAAIFAINMGSRKLSIQTYGTIRDYVCQQLCNLKGLFQLFAGSVPADGSRGRWRIYQRADEIHQLRCDIRYAGLDSGVEHRILQAVQSLAQSLSESERHDCGFRRDGTDPGI